MKEPQFEKKILKNLVTNEEYSRKVLPFLKDEYFFDNSDLVIFQEIKKFTLQYNTIPSIDALLIEVSGRTGLNEEEYKNIQSDLDDLRNDNEKDNYDWLISTTENFCKSKAIYRALLMSMDIAQQTNKKSQLSEGAIPGILEEAIAVTFNPNIGHDYIEDFEQRYEYYHRKEDKFITDLEILNKITNGGFPRKTLNVLMGGTGVGKSLTLCHLASAFLNSGYNVLYISLELSKEEVGKRIDANLMNVTMDDLSSLSHEMYISRVDTIKKKHLGKLVIEEYPTASASTIHFKSLVNDLKLKKKFIPDIIIVDYLNICASSRIGSAGRGDLYGYVKSIAEELRGFAVETNTALLTATQTNRTGFVSSDPGLEDTSESFGLPATADWFAVLVVTDELEELNQIMMKQLKSRYAEKNNAKRFFLGIDRSHMRLYDVENTAQDRTQLKDESTLKGNNSKFARLKNTPF